jgi:hypothetical protein
MPEPATWVRGGKLEGESLNQNQALFLAHAYEI